MMVIRKILRYIENNYIIQDIDVLIQDIDVVTAKKEN